VTAALSLLAERRRLDILRLVWNRERLAGEIASTMPVTFSAVSQHLKVLRDAGLVSVRPDGRRRWYRARPEALGPFAPALEAMWNESLGRLKALTEEEERHART
jgi:DNA-binding transcriptional ArsR family regulator